MNPPQIFPARGPRLSVAGVFLAGLLISASGADEPVKSGWNFELMPKAFQKAPRLEMTVLTDMTEAGKKLPAVSPAAPAFYVAHSAGYHAVGAKPGDKAVPADEVERVLKQALGKSGFQIATPEHAPTLFITYTWGVHGEPLGASPDEAMQVVRDHAALVGGEKFSAELAKAIAERLAIMDVQVRPIPTPGYGAAASMEIINARMDPVRLFTQRSTKNEFLVAQTSEDVYYIVASAYDYRSVAENHRQLLWRTRMTVAASGVAQSDALPTVAAAAGPYFGREMTEPEVLMQHALERGRVEIGEAKVVEMPATAAPPSRK